MSNDEYQQQQYWEDKWIIETHPGGYKFFYPESKKNEVLKMREDMAKFMEETERFLIYGK